MNLDERNNSFNVYKISIFTNYQGSLCIVLTNKSLYNEINIKEWLQE